MHARTGAELQGRGRCQRRRDPEHCRRTIALPTPLSASQREKRAALYAVEGARTVVGVERSPRHYVRRSRGQPELPGGLALRRIEAHEARERLLRMEPQRGAQVREVQSARSRHCRQGSSAAQIERQIPQLELEEIEIDLIETGVERGRREHAFPREPDEISRRLKHEQCAAEQLSASELTGQRGAGRLAE